MLNYFKKFTEAQFIIIKIKFKLLSFCSFSNKTRPVWTDFLIAVRLKLLTHITIKFHIDYKKVILISELSNWRRSKFKII